MHEKDVQKVVTATRLIIRPERRKEFFQTIGPLTQRIRGERGCMNYGLFEETGDENSLIMIEEWENRTEWNDHRNGKNFSVLHGLVNVVSIPSKIDFKFCLQVGGNEMFGDDK